MSTIVFVNFICLISFLELSVRNANWFFFILCLEEILETSKTKNRSGFTVTPVDIIYGVPTVCIELLVDDQGIALALRDTVMNIQTHGYRITWALIRTQSA